MYTTVDDIRNQVITTKAGQVKLGDIAIIEKGYMDPPSNIMHVNGKRAMVSVYRPTRNEMLCRQEKM